MDFNTFTTALSGLDANSAGLNVVGNNLANLNTVGFKGSNISFVDVLGQTVAAGVAGTGAVNLGSGTEVGSVRQDFAAGSIQTTNNPLDVAIQGGGFLVIKGSSGQAYTRAGNLHLDANNNLVADNGMAVQGYVMNPTTGAVDPNLGLQNIQMPAGLESPIQTSNFTMSMNLDGSAANATQFNTSFQVYDSEGNAHMAQITLQKDISSDTPPVTKWRFDVTMPTKDIAGADPNSTGSTSLITGKAAVTPPSAGTLVFDTTGKLQSAYLGADPAQLPALANVTFPPAGTTLPAMANGATLSSGITWNLLNSDRTSGVTGFASQSTVSLSSQNGAAAGSLSSVSVLRDGTISAAFSNGKTTKFAQIALAQFGNVDGLTPAGGGLYQESADSGSSSIGAPATGGRGSLVGGALEQSNVDLATELTKIITFQRGYQANAKLITAADQLMQQTMQMLA